MDAGSMDGLRDLTVAWLDAMRRDALEAGLAPLTQYDQIATRVQAAARTASTVGGWATAVQRRLRVASPSNSASSSLRALDAGIARAAEQNGATTEAVTAELLDMVTHEHGLLIALLRLAAETRAKAWQKRKAEEEAIEATDEAAEVKP